MNLKEIDSYFQQLLSLSFFAGKDASMNGVQVGDFNSEIKCCAFAVDACLESIERATRAGADLLFVHHGLFWGRPLAITESHLKRVKALIDNNMGLYAVHLPLDAHPKLGNNIALANQLQLDEIIPFGNYKGIKIGYQGILKKALSITEIVKKMGLKESECLKSLPFGPPIIKSVGIISGGAPHEVAEAIENNLDLYITGDASHSIYHLCEESNINMVSCGHYATETAGVQAVAKQIRDDLKINTVFIDLPTGL